MMIMKRLENLFDMRIKKKGILPFILIILIIGMIGLCVSCSPATATTSTTVATSAATATTTIPATAANDPKLLGKWVEEIPADIDGLPLDSIEFFTDGKAIIADKDNGTYRSANGILYCTFYTANYSGKYEINGTKLTIYKDSGESKAYLKK